MLPLTNEWVIFPNVHIKWRALRPFDIYYLILVLKSKCPIFGIRGCSCLQGFQNSSFSICYYGLECWIPAFNIKIFIGSLHLKAYCTICSSTHWAIFLVHWFFLFYLAQSYGAKTLQHDQILQMWKDFYVQADYKELGGFTETEIATSALFSCYSLHIAICYTSDFWRY
jgi:hypothetical protein